jgi:hypothetical protein
MCKNKWRCFSSTRRHIWLRHCTTSRKVAGSIPYGVIEIFHLHNPVGCNMAFGSTNPRPEMSTTYISWRKRRLVPCTDNFTTFVCDCLEFNLLEHYGAVIGMYRECLTLVSLARHASVSPVFSKLAIWPPRGPRQVKGEYSRRRLKAIHVVGYICLRRDARWRSG